MAGRTDRHALDLEFDVLLAQMASAGGETGRAVLAELAPLWRQQPRARAAAGAPSRSASASRFPRFVARERERVRRLQNLCFKRKGPQGCFLKGVRFLNKA